MKIKYPKFAIFLLSIVLALYFYRLSEYGPLHNQIVELKLLGAFVAGLLYTYGFTTAFAIALLLVIGEGNNVVLSALLAGLGALLSDLIIFKFIRKSFSDEIVKLEHEKIIEYIDRKIPHSFKKYLIPLLAGLVIASPLPDELGVGILATMKNMTTKTFILASYISNTAGAMIILSIGKLLA